MKELATYGEKISCIPKTVERYISFSKTIRQDGEPPFTMRFLDSFKFKSSSLED